MRRILFVLGFLLVTLVTQSSAQAVFRWPWPGNLVPVKADTVAIFDVLTCATTGQSYVARYVAGADSTWSVFGSMLPARSYAGALSRFPMHTNLQGYHTSLLTTQFAFHADSLYILFASNQDYAGVVYSLIYLRPFYEGDTPPRELRVRP